jgi:creatinine amidohydrolase
LLLDLLASLAQFGFKNIVGINAHGDIEQNVVMVEAFREASEQFPINARYAFPQSVLHHYGLKGDEPYICPIQPQTITVSTSRVADVHAGDIETATMEHFYPHLTDVETARSLPPVEVGDEKIWTWLLGGHTRSLSPDGYLGAPADFEKVAVLDNLNDIADRVSEAIMKRFRNS